MFLSLDPGTTMMIVWFAVILLAAGIEAMTMDLSSIWFSVGAFFALIVSFITDSVLIQSIVFVVFSVGLLVILKPTVKEFMRKNKISTNADSLIGKTAVCLKEIKDGNRGEVKIEGKIWTAISNENIEVDEKVVVLSISGVKLVVKKQ